MPGLLDIAEPTISVPVGSQSVSVYGVGADGIAYLFTKFPQVKDAFAGRAFTFTADDAFTLGPQFVAAIIACGCGNVASPEAEVKAARLGAETQIDIIEAILKLTMPQGVGPFVAKVKKMFAGLEGLSTAAPDTKSPQPSPP